MVFALNPPLLEASFVYLSFSAKEKNKVCYVSNLGDYLHEYRYWKSP